MDPALNMTSRQPQKCQKRTLGVANRPEILEHTRTCICGSVFGLVSGARDLRPGACRGMDMSKGQSSQCLDARVIDKAAPQPAQALYNNGAEHDRDGWNPAVEAVSA